MASRLIQCKHKGELKNTVQLLKTAETLEGQAKLDELGVAGVEALRLTTPRRTGKTAESWSYGVRDTSKGKRVYWSNSNENQGRNIALMLQLGHGKASGGYVKGVDYINPALQPLIEKFKQDIWKEVTK